MSGYKPLRSGISTSKEGAANGVATLNSAGTLAQHVGFFRTFAGQYFSPLTQASANCTLLTTRAYPTPVMVDVDCSVDRVAIRVETAVASSTVEVALYASATNGAAGALIADLGDFDTGTTGYKELTIAQELQAGVLYHILLLTTATGVVLGGAVPLFNTYPAEFSDAPSVGRGWTGRTSAAGVTLAATAPTTSIVQNVGAGVAFRRAA